MKNLVVLTGAGISAESGIKTFRDMNGLWNHYKVEDVASYKAWLKKPQIVCDFYNERRKQLLECEPNNAHKILVDFQKHFNVTIITQNVDNLHEQAGSKNVIHLHGELLKARCTVSGKVQDWNKGELNVGDLSQHNFQLRPHIVWFGEPVLDMELASKALHEADIFLIIGTSMQVYPAAGFVDMIPAKTPVYIIDNKIPDAVNNLKKKKQVLTIEAPASIGMKAFYEKIPVLEGV